jgi:enoyl-CoA hydratase/carnithine racemase
MTDAAPPVIRRESDGVVVLELSRPQARNAFTAELRASLATHLSALLERPPAGVVITGAGGHFSAGGDLKTFASASGEDIAGWLAIAHRCVRAIAAAPFPVVAAVSGSCAGGAVGLALACDAIVAEPDAAFHLPFLRLGLVPDWGATYLLKRKVGVGTATRLMLRPSATDVAQALRIGLVDETAASGEGVTRALALVREMAAHPRDAWAETKRALRHDEVSLDEALAQESRIQARLAGTPEFGARVRALLERPRPPR